MQVKKGRLGAIQDSFLQIRVRNLKKIQWPLCLHLLSQLLQFKQHFTPPKNHTLIEPTVNVNTVVHTSKNARTFVKPTANVNNVVHT